MKKFWAVVTTVIVVIAVIAAAGLVGARLIGYEFYTVLSGSMEPTYHVGSLLFVKHTDPATLNTGDVITFMVNENTIATHRIVEVVPDEEDAAVLRFRTKGDANDTNDGTLVHMNNVIGKPALSIPGAGYVVDYVQHPPGIYVAAIIVAVVVIIAFMPGPSEHAKKTDSEKESEK